MDKCSEQLAGRERAPVARRLGSVAELRSPFAVRLDMTAEPEASIPGVQRCVLCLAVADTSEHVVPKSIGGGLELPVLCRNCNSTLGHDLDVGALRSGPVQEAALVLRDRIPWFWRSIGHHAKAESMSSDVPMQVEKGTGDVQVRTHQDAETGGVWRADSDRAMKEMRKSIRSRIEEATGQGRDPEVDPDELVEKIKCLEPGRRLRVDEIAMEFEKRQDQGVQINLGPPLSRRYFARIGYFSLAIMGIDLDTPDLAIWREFIRGEIDAGVEDGLLLGRWRGLQGDEYLPHHEVLVEHAANDIWQADVALFGRWSWRCTFRLRTPPEAPMFAYAIDLGAGTAGYCTSRDDFENHRRYPLPAPDPMSGW